MKSNCLEHTQYSVRMKINNRMYNTETSWMENNTDYVERGDKLCQGDVCSRGMEKR